MLERRHGLRLLSRRHRPRGGLARRDDTTTWPSTAPTTWRIWTSRELPQRFLEAFAAILSHSNYAPLLDAAARMKARCSRCAVTCPVYQVSGERRDIPCDRSDLLLDVYRRYFTLGGNLSARFGDPFVLDRRPHQPHGRGVLPLHRLPPLQAGVPAGHRPRPDHPPGPLDPGRGRHHAQGPGGGHPGAARGQDPQHLRHPRAGHEGHLRVPRGGLRRRARPEDRVSRSTRRAPSTSSSRR